MVYSDQVSAKVKDDAKVIFWIST